MLITLNGRQKMGCRDAPALSEKIHGKINHASGAVLDVCDNAEECGLMDQKLNHYTDFHRKNQNLKKQR